MEVICPIMVFFLWLGFIGFIIYSYHRSMADKLESFAKKIGFKIILGGFFRYPVIMGTYKGFPCEITTGGTSGNGIVSINMTLPEYENFYFHICPSNFLNMINKRWKKNAFQTGYKDFDNAFFVESDEIYQLVNIFSEDLCKSMLLNKNYINIYLYGNKFRSDIPLAVINERILLDLAEILCKMAHNMYGKEIPLTQKTEDTISSRQLICNDNEQDFKICLSCKEKLYPPYSKFCINCGEII